MLNAIANEIPLMKAKLAQFVQHSGTYGLYYHFNTRNHVMQS